MSRSKHCAALGFDGLELTVIPRWPTDAATMDAAERKRIRKLYDDHHIDLCGLSGNTPLLKGDAGRTQRATSRPSRPTSISRRSCSIPANASPSARPRRASRAVGTTVKDELVDLFGTAAAHAERAGVIVGVGAACQQCPAHAGAGDLARSSRSTRPRFGIHFDISHFNVQGMDMEEVVAQLVPYSVHTHVKDERGIAPNHEFLIPGEGDMDYVGYLKAMDRAGWHEHITVEISLMVQARPDFDALAAATQSYSVLSQAFRDAGIARPTGRA